jgi:hypothetical protein
MGLGGGLHEETQYHPPIPVSQCNKKKKKKKKKKMDLDILSFIFI